MHTHSPARAPQGRPPRENGTTLIEALVAMVVLSVGVLGMVGLQANALKLNQTSLQRSQATILAYAILDQMRSDTAAARAGDYDVDIDDTPADGDTTKPWHDELIRSLGPDAAGGICRLATADAAACGAGEFFRITVRWVEAQITDASGENSWSDNDDPRELIVVGRL